MPGEEVGRYNDFRSAFCRAVGDGRGYVGLRQLHVGRLHDAAL